MFIKKVEFEVDAHSVNSFPKPLKGEIAFIGRSNVGKSSLLNALFGKKIAKTSSTPGKTRSLIFFKINANYHLVDFPGYGYARSAKFERNKWAALVEEYFQIERPRRATFLLVDSRIPVQSSDLNAFEWLMSQKENVVVVPTKIDKLKRSELQKKLGDIKSVFDGSIAFLPVSSSTRDGLKSLDSMLRNCVRGDQCE